MEDNFNSPLPYLFADEFDVEIKFIEIDNANININFLIINKNLYIIF